MATRTTAERYDSAAARYGRWWAPVLEPTALRFMDTVARVLDRPPERVLDIGTGTGVLALTAVQRWPSARLDALDGSSGMLTAARARASGTLSNEQLDRLEFVIGRAEELPFEDGTYDAVISSFVFQLVSNRPRALAEARRVLRPGGLFAYVTWLEDTSDWRPQEAFDDAVDDLRIEEDEIAEESRSGDLPSPAAAAAQLRRAGFHRVVATEERLEYRWTPESYLDFLEEYDEWDLFSSLDPPDRARLRVNAQRRFARLDQSDFHLRTPVVVAFGRRPVAGRR
jgi:ubiquinone/menaquinone biosynthesis C-methylase UbiE